MVDITKLDMTDIWASSGDKTAPDPSKIATGWIVEVVPRQWWNWFENRQDQNIAYMLQKGIPEWDSFTEYLINKSYVQRNNIVYKCIQTGTNQDPATAPLYWVKAFPESSASLESIRNLTPAADRVAYFTGANSASLMTVTALARTLLDDDNVTTMRSTLGAQASNTNLTALSGATAATNTFPYWNSATTMLASPITAFGRSLIAAVDAAGARAVLGLSTGATSTVTTSNTDVTANRLLKVGDFGIGIPIATVNIDNLLSTGIYQAASNGGGVYPVGFGNGSVIVTQRNVSPYRASQLLLSDGDNRSWRRSNGGTWGAWAEVWSTDNLVKTTSATDTTTGRMLKVGDFGLGSVKTTILASLNDTTTAVGFYAADIPTVGLPTGVSYGLVTVVRHPVTDTIAQELIVPGGHANNNRKFFRAYNTTAGAWRAWNEMYHSGNTYQVATDLGLNAAATAPVTGSGNAVMSVSPALTGFPSAPTASVGTNNTQIASTAFVLANSATNPAGTILAFAGSSVPSGYLIANGAALSRATYSALFGAISTTYGAGDGSTTFNIPDLRGEFLRGLDNGRGVDSGRALGTFQASQMSSHTHTFTGNAYGGHTHGASETAYGHNHTFSNTTNSAGAHSHRALGTSSGGSAAHMGSGTTTAICGITGANQGYYTNAGGSSSPLIEAVGDHQHAFSGTTTTDNHVHTITIAAGGAFTPSGTNAGAGGTGNSSETRPRNVALQFLIKF